MIDTIFYFPDSLTYSDYLSKLNSDAPDGIAPHVIVFAGQQKAIYLKGLKFSTSSQDIQAVVDQSRYDDTYIREQIQSILTDVARAKTDMDAINSRIDGIHQYEQSQIEDIANGAIEKSQYIKDKLNELGDEFDGYIKTDGFDDLANSWALEYIIPSIDGEGNGITFSDLVVKADVLKAAVDKITTSIGEDGSKLQNILESYIKTTVSNDETIAEIRSAWALQDENKRVLEWMTSSYSSYASGNKTFAQILSAAQANAASGAAQTAVANLKSEIMRDINGDIKDVVSDMVSSISTTDANNNTTVTATSIASAIANSTEAKTTLGAYFTDENQVNNLVQTKLNASVDGASWSSFVSGVASDHTAIGNISTRVESLEGVDTVTSSMISSIIDENGNIKAASIIAAVNNDDSEVYISADKIRMDGQVYAEYLAANYMTVGRLLNQLYDRSVLVEEGKITLSSQATKQLYAFNDDDQYVERFLIDKNGNISTIVTTMAKGTPIEAFEQIVLSGDKIYNIPIDGSTSAYAGSGDVAFIENHFKTPGWRIGIDQDQLNDSAAHLGEEVAPPPTGTTTFSMGTPQHDNYVIETSKGYGGRLSLRLNAGIKCDGNMRVTERIDCDDTVASSKVKIKDNLYIGPDAEVNIWKGHNVHAMNDSDWRTGVTDTISVPSIESGKHYNIRIDKGIITGCTLVND